MKWFTFSNPAGVIQHHPEPDTHPMSLGSPPPGPTHSPYLPGFLLGDKVQRPTASPGGQKMWHNTGGVGSMSAVTQLTPTAQSTRTSFSPRTDAATPKMGGREVVGAPPIRRLAGDLIAGTATSAPTTPKHVSFNTPVFTQTPGQRTLPSTPAPPTSGLCQELNSSTLPQESAYTSLLASPPSPAQVDPFYTQGEQLSSTDSLDETCVTIFGFPPAATSYMLQQFSQYGTIVRHVIASEGNWMHVKFQSKLQAKKALSKNGKIFANGIMVGVTPCIDRTIMTQISDDSHFDQSTTLDTSTRLDTSTSRGTPTMIRPLTAAYQAARSQNQSGGTLDTSTMIRRDHISWDPHHDTPLTAAYQAARSQNQVVTSGNIPHKNNNFVSKAMEFMFGW